MWARASLLCGFLGAAGVGLAGPAVAQLLPAYFPDGVPGYGTQDGVTVETRLHPELMPLGVRAGAFTFWPRWDEGTGFSSNAQPGPSRRGSWEIVTAPSLNVTSDWSRNALGAAISVQDTRYLGLPAQDRTDAAMSLGGRIDFGGDALTLGVAHVSQHEDRSQIDTIASDRPIAFQLDDARAAYALTEGRWRIEPALQATRWTYGDTTIEGVPASQSYRDRIVGQGGMTVRYDLAPLRSVVVVLRAVGQSYTRPGPVSPDSTRYQMLAGFDYDDDAVWRWRLLGGGEIGRYASAAYPTQNTMIAEAGAGWAPNGMTTVNASISRETDDAAQEGVSGLVASSAGLTIDRELLRTLLLRASGLVERADYFQGGHQTGTRFGVALIWSVNRGTKLSFTYDQTDLRGSAGGVLGTGYSRGLQLITLRLSL